MKKSIPLEISHDSVIPLHTQLLNQLRQFILSGRWEAGYRLPSESVLQRHLNISRSTIRQALGNAEVEGLINRVPGRGTFVASIQMQTNTKAPIAFVVFDFDSQMQRDLLMGAERVAREAGYRVIFCNSYSDAKQEIRILDQLQQDNVAGILLWPSVDEGNPAHLSQLSQQPFPPVTMMDRTFNNINWDYVASDNYNGGYMATKHLLDLGHKSVVFLSCRIFDLLPIVDRYRGYETAMKECNYVPEEPWLIGKANQEITSGYALRAYGDTNNDVVLQIAEYMQANAHQVSAIVAMNDNIALLALKAAAMVGLKVPDDLSIVGYDDTDLASYLPTPLTTVEQKSFTIGKQAASLLIERIEGRYSGTPRSILIPTQLRVRASTSIVSHRTLDPS